MDVLRRRCERLLWAYPNWYRRERGLEMLSTLLDAAEAGQRWPARADVLDVVGGGIRCRLRPPRGRWAAIVTVAAALFAALAGSTAAAMLFAAAAPVPTEGEALAVAEIATGQVARNLPGVTVRCTYWCPEDWQPNGDQVVTYDDPFAENNGVDHVSVAFWTPRDQVPAIISDARTRLIAADWTIEEYAVQDDGTHLLTAGKNGQSLVLATSGEPAAGPSMLLRIEPHPAALPAVAIAGFVGGLLAGWMLTTWVLQRHRRHHAAIRVATALLALPTLPIMVVVDAMVTRSLLTAGVLGAPSAPLATVPLLPAFDMSILVTLTGIPVLLGLATAVVAIVALAALPIGLNTPPIVQVNGI